VSGHVVRAFIVVLVAVSLRSHPREEPLDIAPGGGSGILLDEQGRGRVSDEQGQQAVPEAMEVQPRPYLARNLVQASCRSGDA
jgi:hypothetical protein